MRSVSIRQLRNTRQWEEWLEAGETVELRKHSRVLGQITPRSATQPSKPVEWPDFAARRRRIFGDRVIPAVEMLIEDREDRF